MVNDGQTCESFANGGQVNGGQAYEELFYQLHQPLYPYYRSWTHDEPLVLSHARDAELRRMSELLYRAACFYASSYRDYLDIVDYSDKVLEILAYAEQFPFSAGTWRPDYLVLDDGRLMFCEITSRFFGNGYFLSSFMEHAGACMAQAAGVTDRTTYFEDMLTYFAEMAQGRTRLVVLKSADKSDSIRLYVPFYEALGLQAAIVEAPEVEDSAGLFDGSLLVSALNQHDLLSYSMDTLKRMADAHMRNDFRTIFLLHDKRFFSLLFEDAFTKRFLSNEETAFLRAHTVETYVYSDSAIWEDARRNKDAYILKHHCLGKSEQVYAGCLTSADTWEELFAAGAVRDMILQPFMRQRMCQTQWQGQQLDDYVAGTVLTIDECYFGTGLFRTSTSPVINQTDAHKMAPIVTDQAAKLPGCYLL